MSETQLAPTPDYSSGLPPEVEACSCDEALALQAEVARLTECLAFWTESAATNFDAMCEERTRADAAEARCAELETRLTDATDLVIEAVDGHAENPHWIEKATVFLAGQVKP